MLPVESKKPLPSLKGAFTRTLERAKAKRLASKPVRIGFVIDATGSREHSWEQAQRIQSDMFKSITGLRSLRLRVLHFGGATLTDIGWQSNPRDVAKKMAAVRCSAGLTQTLPALSEFLEEAQADRAKAIILVGDSFEEDCREAQELGHLLKSAGIKLFCFLEGDDWIAETEFRDLAATTGGAFAQFGDDLPLADLCEGVALLCAGGKTALYRLNHTKAKQLLLAGPQEGEKEK